MKRKTLSLSVLTVLIIAAALSTGCSKKKKTAAAPPPPEVEVATVVQKDVPINR